MLIYGSPEYKGFKKRTDTFGIEMLSLSLCIVEVIERFEELRSGYGIHPLHVYDNDSLNATQVI